MIFDWRTEIGRYRYYFLNFRTLAQRKDIRSFGELSLTLLVISFFLFFAIKPTLVIIAGLTKEIKDKEEVSQKLQTKIASILSAQQEYSLNQDRFYLVDQALPETPDFPLLILAMQKEATSAGVAIESISITKIEIKSASNQPNSSIPNFEFTSSVTGNYSNLKQFLSQIENLRRVVNFDQVSFSKVKKTNQTNNEPEKTRLMISGKANFYPTN
jgi:Tfp pilus assembly protein PilO